MRRRFRFPVFLWIALATAPVAAGTLSGHVTDEAGNPLAGVDLDFFIAATGDERSANGDVTDATGFYSVTMDPEIYTVTFQPVPGARLAGHEEDDVNLNVNQTLDVVLPEAWFVSGQVLRADDGLPAVGVDLDFEDLSTGVKIYTPLDSTGLDGFYSVAVPRGIYRVTYDGPEPEFPSDPPLLHHGVVEEISVDGTTDFALPTQTLGLGYFVDGEVLDEFFDGVVNADLDFLLPDTQQKIFTKTDNSDASGQFETIVPAGTYDVEVNPPPGSGLVTARINGFVVAADTSLGSIELTGGPSVAGTVSDPDAALLGQVDLDFRTAAGGARVSTSWDDTNASGQFDVVVPPGSYDITFRPLLDSRVEPVELFAVSSGTSGLAVQLPFHDEDADGTPDRYDGCPFLADPGQADGDGDGIGDACDLCPLTFDPRQADNDGDRLGDLCDDDDDNDGVADAVDADRDGDGIADVADNCPQARNADQRNVDADADGDACDPDDGEVERLLAGSASGFFWRPETGATGYRVYRQRREWLSGINYGVCVQTAAAGTTLVDTETPAPGSVLTYLVAATTATGEGSLGPRGDGATRPNLRPCP